MIVFVDEMGVPPELEIDEADFQATHLAGKLGGKTVATLRIVMDYRKAKIGRVAIDKSCRGRGFGIQIMHNAIAYCRDAGIECLELASQCQVVPFYEKLGFIATGEIFEDAGIPHQKMYLKADGSG